MVPFHYDDLLGLELVEESLAYYEKHLFGRHILRMPHPNFYKHLRDVIYQPIRRAELLTAASIPHLNHHDVLRMVKDQEGIEGEILSATGLHGLDNAVRFISIRKHGPIAAAAGPGAYFSSSGAGWATSSCFPGGYIPALSEVWIAGFATVAVISTLLTFGTDAETITPCGSCCSRCSRRKSSGASAAVSPCR